MLDALKDNHSDYWLDAKWDLKKVLNLDMDWDMVLDMDWDIVALRHLYNLSHILHLHK